MGRGVFNASPATEARLGGAPVAGMQRLRDGQGRRGIRGYSPSLSSLGSSLSVPPPSVAPCGCRSKAAEFMQ